MPTQHHETDSSTPTTGFAILVGFGVGVAILAFYLITGYVVADWNFQEFLTYLTPATVGWMALAGGTVIAVFGIPIAAYLRFRVKAPIVVLVVVFLGWIFLGIGQGIPLQAVFGLAYYAFAFSPVYIFCYLVFGGVEYRARNSADTVQRT